MTWRAPVTRIALLLMETMWTYAAIATFVALVANGGRPPFIAVALVVFLSYGISRGFQESDLDIGIIRVWGTVASFLLFYGIARVAFFSDWRFWDFRWANNLFTHFSSTADGDPEAFWGIPVLWLAWMRGLVRGQDRYGWNDVLGTFGVGIIVVAVAEVFASIATDTPSLVRQIPVPFGVLGLVSIGLAHAGRGDGAGRPFSFTWLAAVGGAIAGVALVAVVIAVAYIETFGRGLGATARTTGSAVSSVSSVIAWPMNQLAAGLYATMEFFFRLLGVGGKPPDQPPSAVGDLADCMRARLAEGMSSEQATHACEPGSVHVPAFFRYGVEAIVAIIVIYVLYHLTAGVFRRFQKREGETEVKESTYQEGRLGKDLSDLLGGLARRLRPNLRFGGERLDPVQRLYFDMAGDAQSRGVQRRAPETPLELAPALVRSYGGGAPAEITDAFDSVRYGEHPAIESEARRLREEWDALRQERDR